MYKVMIRDSMSPLAREILEDTGQIEVIVDNDKATGTPEALSKIIGDFHGLAIRSGTRVSEAVFNMAPNLKVIGRAGIGVDNIDVQAATRRGVVVMNAPGGNTVTTAEHAITMMLSLARNVPQATASMRQGLWEKKALGGVEITGKTLGIVGLGQIGRVVAERARGLKMKVISSDPYVSRDAADHLHVELTDLEDLLARSDFITLHVPRLKETSHMINAETLSKMKPGVRLINCSRGEVVHLDDLVAALDSGHVAGAALDVLPMEPPDPKLPILKHPNVILTPHLGASTGEAQDKVAEMIARQISAYLVDGVITHAVNFPSVSVEVMEKLRPHIDLAEKMGSLMGQLVRGVHDVSITYGRGLADLDTRPLTHAVLKGLLGAYTDTPVNFVSAPALAREKGIHVKETISHEKTDDFPGVIKLKLEGVDKGPDQIWATIFEKKYPRIVRLGQIYMDAIPEGSMIVIQNIDRPGVIGNIGTTLGKHDINIGRFQLGRRGDRALCMVNIDTPAGEEVLEEILGLPNMLVVQQVHLS
ncbi:D-3-phosphoglycerate dehydrogenase (EC [Olavius algarvensis associated proteobacterium Delta 3]|nr:D-3-phosphoglycerate dehydrogenase (EC [Olavius algarvensis associated proteobacterium Delta 3]CAB5157283.1 D-3-phosphoglycerate dehydrogenase (EC [Olavius algarvensis associated proteobacterium Delta 3]